MDNRVTLPTFSLPPSLQALLDAGLEEKRRLEAAQANEASERRKATWRALAEVARQSIPSDLFLYLDREVFRDLEEESPPTDWKGEETRWLFLFRIPGMRLISGVYFFSDETEPAGWAFSNWLVDTPWEPLQFDSLQSALVEARQVWLTHNDDTIPF